jgi:deoxyribodipyrimidine photo-lyase
MGRPDVQVVWFKRDLRVSDHASLTAAVDTGTPVLPLYVLEPSLIAHPHTSSRHIELVLDGSLLARARGRSKSRSNRPTALEVLSAAA